MAANYLFLFLAFCCYLLQQSGSLEGTLAFAIWVVQLKKVSHSCSPILCCVHTIAKAQDAAREIFQTLQEWHLLNFDSSVLWRLPAWPIEKRHVADSTQGRKMEQKLMLCAFLPWIIQNKFVWARLSVYRVIYAPIDSRPQAVGSKMRSWKKGVEMSFLPKGGWAHLY